jgi:hypothetical protein
MTDVFLPWATYRLTTAAPRNYLGYSTHDCIKYPLSRAFTVPDLTYPNKMSAPPPPPGKGCIVRNAFLKGRIVQELSLEDTWVGEELTIAPFIDL